MLNAQYTDQCYLGCKLLFILPHQITLCLLYHHPPPALHFNIFSHLLVAWVWTTAGHHLHHILNCHVAYSQCRCQSLFQADHNSQWGPLHNDHKLHQIPGIVSHPNSQSVSQSLKSEWLSPLEPQKQKKSGRVVSWLQDESLVGSPALLVPHSSPCRRRRRSQVTI